MNDNQMTFQKYRSIDLVIFAIITTVFEAVCVFAAKKWFAGAFYSISIVPIIVCLVLMRWNGFAAIHALLGGFVSCFVVKLCGTSISWQLYAVYCIGNLFAILSLLMFKFVGKEKIRENFLLSELFAFVVFLLIEIGRALVSLTIGAGFHLGNYLFSDSISLLLLLVAIFILRKRDGMFEDQKHYLFRVERKAKEEDDYNGRDMSEKNQQNGISSNKDNQ